MIHDANDTHLDGHTFATTDTTVVLTWTETSYGEKTYTKLLNGASIGTETITLTDPNASTVNPPLILAITNWSVNNDPAEPKRFEYQGSHIDNNPTNHVYIYQAILGTYTTEEWTIQFKNDSTNGLGWYDHGSANPTDTNHGNGTFLYTSWDGGNDNCIVQNDDFFINYTLPPPTYRT